MPNVNQPQAASSPETIQCVPDQGFVEWVAESGGVLAVSTYQAGKLLLVGWNGRQITLLMRHFDKPLGLDAEGDRMVLATRHGVHAFGNSRPLAHNYREPGRYDSLFLPRASWHTPDLNIHDVALAGETIWLAVTRFSCLAHPSLDHTFEPVWRPPFVDDLVPEDRCHLNGFAMVDGRPKYVTCLGATNTPGGWRENKASGGIVVDVGSGEIISRGLAMPHSPRWHGDALWLLNSGAGELVQVDLATGGLVTACRLQGYLRGLTLVGDCAVVCLSKIRETNIFGGMPVQEIHDRLLCAVQVVHLASGRVVGSLEFTAGCSELYDVRFLPGLRRPNILDPGRPDVKDAVSVPGAYYWLRPENQLPD